MSVRFDAASDRLSYSASNPPSPNSGFTVTLWAWVSVSRGDYSTLVRLWAASDSNVPLTFDTDSNGLNGPHYFSTSGIVNGSLNMAVGEWRKLAVSRSAGGTGKTYAALSTGLTTVTSGAIGSIPDPIGITLAGRTPAEANEWFNGRLTYVRVWSRELSQAEIEAEWASATPVSTTGLFADWPLESAADLTDHSGNGHTLVADATEGPTSVTTAPGPPLAADRPGAVVAAGVGQTLAVGRSLADRPAAVQVGSPATVLVTDQIQSDRPSLVLVGGPLGEQVSVITPVVIVDRPAAGAAAGGGQSLVTDRLLSDRPTVVGGGAPGQVVVFDVIRADRPGHLEAGLPTGERIDRGTILSDRPGAVTASGLGQIVVVDVIRQDRPGFASAAGAATRLSSDLDVTVADRAWHVLAASVGQHVVASPPPSPFPKFPGRIRVSLPRVPTLVMDPPTTLTAVLPVLGPPGPQGLQGVPGDPGGALASSVTVTNQTLVQINHGLPFKPAGIICLDTATPANPVEYATISYPVAGITELTFGFPFTGTIFVS
jgi:hypothetical protein